MQSAAHSLDSRHPAPPSASGRLGCTTAQLDSIRDRRDLGYRLPGCASQGPTTRSSCGRDKHPSLLLPSTVLDVYVLSRDLAGPAAALGASLVRLHVPTSLAHGRLVTPDIRVACFGVCRCGLRAPRAAARHARVCAPPGALAGLAGLAVNSRGPSSWCSRSFLPVFSGRRGSVLPASGRSLAAALFVMYAAYGFRRPDAAAWLAYAPSRAVSSTESKRSSRKRRTPRTRWASYAKAAGGRTTISSRSGEDAAALTRALRAGSGVRRPRLTHRVRSSVGSSRSSSWLRSARRRGRTVGLRYILPALPLLHVTTAAAFSFRWRVSAVGIDVARGGTRASPRAARRWPRSAGSSVSSAASGPCSSTQNLDWGQALPDLRAWQDHSGIKVVQLAYFGRIDPSIYGIRWRTLPSTPVRGPSRSARRSRSGRPCAVLMKDNGLRGPYAPGATAETWSWLRESAGRRLGGGAILVWKDIGPAWDAAQAAQMTTQRGPARRDDRRQHLRGGGVPARVAAASRSDAQRGTNVP